MHETAARPALSLWPPDDTEKSVLGTNLHQTAITAVRTAANEAASQEQKPWQAGSQTRVSGFVRPGGRPYAALPDVFVYREPFDLRRATLSLAEDGPPTLIVEVLSDDTWKADLDTERGKGFSYRRGGVAEYLALDPLGEFTGRAGGGLRRPRAADARRGAGAPRGHRGPSRGACGTGVAMLLRLLAARFGPLPAGLKVRLAARATPAALETLTDIALAVPSLADFLEALDRVLG